MSKCAKQVCSFACSSWMYNRVCLAMKCSTPLPLSSVSLIMNVRMNFKILIFLRYIQFRHIQFASDLFFIVFESIYLTFVRCVLFYGTFAMGTWSDFKNVEACPLRLAPVSCGCRFARRRQCTAHARERVSRR